MDESGEPGWNYWSTTGNRQLDHLSSPSVCWGVTSGAGAAYPVRSTRLNPRVLVKFVLLDFLVLCKCFVDRCLSLCTFSFDHCVVCPSIYGFWLPLWYIQTFNYIKRIVCLYKQSNQILRRSVCWTTETPFFWWCQCCLGCWEDIVVQRLIFLMSRNCTMERWRRASQRYEAIVFIRNRNIGTT